MKFKKAAGAALAIGILAFSFSASAQSFSDVSERDWFCNAVNYVTERQYFAGMNENEFSPNTVMTRAMFVTVLGRMADIDRSDYTKQKFRDVPAGLWYSTYVNWAASSGIIAGFEDGLFHPESSVNREQIAVILNNYLTVREITLAENPNALASYSDENSVSEWAKPGVALMRSSGIIAGDGKGNFNPKSAATRAEIANVLMRLSMAVNGEALAVPTPEPYSRSGEILEEMSLTEKVYQMFFVTPEQLTDVQPVTAAGETTRKAISEHPVGGLLYSADNLVSDYQIKTMLSNTKEYSKITPFLAVEEEGGEKAPVSDKLGASPFESMYSYRNEQESKAYEIGAALADNISRFGFNQDFAPVADVWTNMDNTTIRERAFSTDSNTAAVMSSAVVKGMKDKGMIATLKYFPGYGSCGGDANNTRVYNNRSLAQLESCEFVPFKSGIEAGADFVMCANINLPELDSEYPVPMSQKIVTDTLRTKLNFSGIVITDSLKMNAIRSYYTSAEAAVKCIEAGCDMLQSPDTLSEAVSAVISAVQDGRISEQRINESVKRILDVKLKYGIIS